MARYLLPFIFFAAIIFTSCSHSRKLASGNTTKGRRTSLTEKELRQKYASRVAASPGDIDNISLYRFIDDWYGVPYRYGGTGRNGIDCSAFSTKLYTAVYSTNIPRTAQLQYDSSKKIRKGKLKEGDLVFFNEGGRKITHVGVYLRNHYFVHASTGRGVMISNLDDDYWEEHFVKGGKIK